MQLGLVEALDAGLADVRGAAVIDRVEAFQLFLGNSPHVTHRVGEMRPLRIMPDQLRDHLHARQAELVDRDTGDLLLGQLEQDRHRLKRPAPLFDALFENGPIVRGQFENLDDGIQHLGPLTTGTLAGHAQAEAGTVVGHHHAVAVVDQAARWRNGQHVDTVVFRQRRVIVVLHHLKEVQAGDQYANQHDDHASADHDAAAHGARVLFVVLEADRL
jgi:hypothetical protein